MIDALSFADVNSVSVLESPATGDSVCHCSACLREHSHFSK